VRAIALIDSPHTLGDIEGKNNLLELFLKHSINWITSKEPIGTPLKEFNGSPCISGGHSQIPYCISNSKNSIFDFFTQKLSHHQ
jgi:hypothetical protein